MPPEKASPKVGSWPTPEKPLSLEISIPVELLREFDREVRLVVRHPWCIGIPIPEKLLKPDILEKLGPGLGVMITPKPKG